MLRKVSQENMRQALIITGMSLNTLMEGYLLGQGTSMAAGLYADKEALNLTDDIISWILSLLFLPMIFGSLLATVMIQQFGRRLSITLFNVPLIICYIMLYYAKDGNVLITCRLLGGFYVGGIHLVAYMTTAEYSSPTMRGTFLAILTAMELVGGTVGKFLGLAFSWRNAALIGVPPAIIAGVLPLFYVESPSWLASRGRFDECKVAFRALHGLDSEKELQLLLEVEKSKRSKMVSKTGMVIALGMNLVDAVKKKYFWNVIAIGLAIQVYKIVCGNVMNSLFGITMLQTFTGQSDVLPFTATTDGLVFLGCAISSVLLSKFRTRIVLFSGGVLNNIILIALSTLLYVSSVYGRLYPWVSTLLLGFHCLVLNASAYPLLEVLPQELYPLEIKPACLAIVSLFNTIGMFTYTKMIPALFILIDYYGMFMFNVTIMCICLLYFSFTLPETKGRTLQEVELYFKTGSYGNIEKLVESDKIKDLV